MTGSFSVNFFKFSKIYAEAERTFRNVWLIRLLIVNPAKRLKREFQNEEKLSFKLVKPSSRKGIYLIVMKEMEGEYVRFSH